MEEDGRMEEGKGGRVEEWKMEGWKVDQDFQDFQDLTRIRGKGGRRWKVDQDFQDFQDFYQDKRGRVEGWKSGRV